MAKIRSAEWGEEEYWNIRITGYMNGELHPHLALLPRIMYVALNGKTVIGFIAGHLTRRFECEAELQWINVAVEYRLKGIASELLRLLATWFVEQNAFRVCVDPDDEQFYKKNGAQHLNDHWMVWENIGNVLKK